MMYRSRIHPGMHGMQSSASDSVVASRDRERRGAVAVEMALMAPFLAAMTLGICEIGQLASIQSYLSEAAYAGCSTGSQPASSNSTVISNVKNCLIASNVTAASAVITIKVNNVAADVATAQLNDEITVTVAVPISAVSWVGTYYFVPGSSVLTRTVVMLKQG